MPKFSRETFLILILLLVIAARPIQLPISIISGKTVWLEPFSSLTPVIFKRFEPRPSILAPIEISNLHNC